MLLIIFKPFYNFKITACVYQYPVKIMLSFIVLHCVNSSNSIKLLVLQLPDVVVILHAHKCIVCIDDLFQKVVKEKRKSEGGKGSKTPRKI